MIIVTGTAGFIGSCTVSQLIENGFEDIVSVDKFDIPAKEKNHNRYDHLKVDRRDFIEWFIENKEKVSLVIHLGARTDTTESDTDLFDALNLNYTKAIWNICTETDIPLIYASSAATYGLGELGYEDNHKCVNYLKPLNAYGDSKNDFDKWALKQEKTPPFWAGLKFFNVYGPNEYHKSRMASVVFHTFNQIKANGNMKLFRSHNPEYKDGHQKRDFIYVKDLVSIILHLVNTKPESGLYNVGTGEARTFLDLATNTFKALGMDPEISFVDTPIDIRDKYQYFTQADMSKLRATGYDKPFSTLEEGVQDYVQNYLVDTNYM